MMRRLFVLIFAVTFAIAAFAGDAPQPRLSASALQVAAVQSEEGITLPAEFRVALYENMISQITKTGRFTHVYRDGEKPADPPTTVTLRSTVWGFKEGSARMRQVTTVAGATKIKVRIQVVDNAGKTLLERSVNGNVYFLGENLRATYNFSKSVAKIIQDSFAKPPAMSAAARN